MSEGSPAPQRNQIFGLIPSRAGRRHPAWSGLSAPTSIAKGQRERSGVCAVHRWQVSVGGGVHVGQRAHDAASELPGVVARGSREVVSDQIDRCCAGWVHYFRRWTWAL
jgi:hypothetical protein